jgi:hypothetical protein
MINNLISIHFITTLLTVIFCISVSQATQGDSIPKIIYQTYFNKSLIPKKVYDNIALYASGYKHVIFDDTDCMDFLEVHFGDQIKNVFKALTGAHRADLFRYAVMYIRGGIYLDIKTQLISDISLIFSSTQTSYFVASYVTGTIYDGVIAAPPGIPLFHTMVRTVKEWVDNTYNVTKQHSRHYEFKLRMKYKKQRNPVISLNYFRDQYALYSLVGSEVGLIHPKHNVKLQSVLKNETYVWVFEERCSYTDSSACSGGFDRYGACCVIVGQGDAKVINVRYSDYPWKG